MFSDCNNDRFVSASTTVLNIIESEFSDIYTHRRCFRRITGTPAKSNESSSREISRRILTFPSCPNSTDFEDHVSTQNTVVGSEECFLRNEIESDCKLEFMPIHINLMKQLQDTRQKKLQAEKNAFVKNLLKRSSEVISLEAVDTKLRKIQTLNQHLSKILEEAELIKHKLQNPVLHNVLNVKVDYHRFVLQFFEFSIALVNELAISKENLEWLSNQKHWDNFSMEPLVTNTCRNVVVLQNSLDSLLDFRLKLQAMADSVKGRNVDAESQNDVDVLIKI